MRLQASFFPSLLLTFLSHTATSPFNHLTPEPRPGQTSYASHARAKSTAPSLSTGHTSPSSAAPSPSLPQRHPAEDRWSALDAMPVDTDRGSAIVGVHGDTIYLAGGMTTLDPEYQDAVRTVTAFDTRLGTWLRLPEEAAQLPEGRQHGVGAVARREFHVLWGGGGGRGGDMHNVKGEVFVLDLEDLECGWRTGREGMPTPRGGLAGGVVGKRFFAFGGEANVEGEMGIFEEVEVLDLQTQQWSELSPMAVARHGTTAAAVGGRIYIPGGGLQQDGFPIEIDGAEHLLRTMDHFDAYVVQDER